MTKLSKEVLYAVIAAIIVAFAVFYAWIWYQNKSLQKYSDGAPVYAALLVTNDSFAEGQAHLRANDVDAAIRSFEAALVSSEDSFQEGMIRLKIAAATSVRDPLASVPLFKAIANNPSYAYATRAYALQYLGELYYNPYSGQWEELREATFTDEPFASMYEQQNTRRAYGRLAAYATSLYSLPIVELRVADWYADGLFGARAASSSAERRSDMIAEVKQRIEKADAGMAAMAADESTRDFVPVALQIKAVVLRKLFALREVPRADVEQAFIDSVSAFDAESRAKGLDGYARFNAAVFLAGNEARRDEARALLAPLYEQPLYASTSFGNFMRSVAKTRQDSQEKVAYLAGIDSRFKAFAESLGWTDADFE